MVLWLLFAIMSLASSGFMGIIHRYVLKEHDWISYNFVESLLTALFFIPLVLLSFSLPTSPFAFYVLLAAIGLWTLAWAASAKSFQLVEASERSPLKQTQIIFLLIFSYFFLSEVLTFNKVAGSLLIFVGVVLISYKKGHLLRKFNDRGFQFILLSALLTAIVSLVDKIALSYWNPATYSFFVYLFPGLIFGGFLGKRKDSLKKMMKSRYLIIIIVSAMEVIYYYTRLVAFSLTDVSNVFPILRLSTLVTVVGGIILLKERKNIWQKIVSAIIMVAGAWLITQ
jgi:drug/metabolite transporter (DMT)-like permease